MLKILSIFALSIVEMWAAVPIGFAMHLHPFVIGFAASTGSVLGGCLVILLGERFRGWLLLHRGGNPGKDHSGRIVRIWVRFGVPGLGLLAPPLTGSPLAAALGVTLGAPPRKLMFWIGIGAVIWSTAFTAACMIGLETVKKFFFN